jgi:hypothetical protein
VQILGARVGRQALGFRLHLARKSDAEAVLAGDGEELHLGIVGGSEHLFEHAAHAATAGRRRREAHARHQARVRVLRLCRADDLDDRQPIVERHRHPALAMALERADELGVLALDDRGHAAGRPLGTMIAAHDFDPHAIAVQRRALHARRDEDVARELLPRGPADLDESEPARTRA